MTGLTSLFAPRGLAVIGASAQPGKLGNAMAKAVAGFDGPIGLVNSRNPDPASGIYVDMATAVEAVGQLDLALLCVPAPACASALRDAAAAGAGAALICAGGFAEIGAAGAEHDAAVRRAVADTGIRLLGPNTSGFFAPHRGLAASFVPDAARLAAGKIAVVAASGGVNHALAFELASLGHGLSLGVGIGAGHDVGAADVLEYLRTDSDTTAVALHLETVPDGPRLVAAVRELAAVKPVVALVVGRSDVGDFAQSHTGALATSWRTTQAALAQAGAVLVDDERELVDAVSVLSSVRLPPNPDPGLAIITAQAGPGLLLADRAGVDRISVPELAEATQLRLGELLPPLTFQRNPVDTGRPGATFGAVLETVVADPAIDLACVYALTEPDSVDLAQASEQAGLATGAPVIFGIGGLPEPVDEVRTRLAKLGLASGTTPAAVSTMIRALVTDARLRSRPTVDPGAALPDSPPVPSGPLTEASAKDYLTLLGIATPTRRPCANAEQAQLALAEIGGPIAVKISDPAILHKSDVGGVQLGIETPEQLDRALAAIGSTTVLIEQMAPAGVDLIVGARRDPVFGPIVLVGLGGTWAEAVADTAIRLAPLSPSEAATMVDDLTARALLQGWRGGPTLDGAALGEIAARLGQVLVDHADVDEIEINPLRLTDTGLIALDAVIVNSLQAS